MIRSIRAYKLNAKDNDGHSWPYFGTHLKIKYICIDLSIDFANNYSLKKEKSIALPVASLLNIYFM